MKDYNVYGLFSIAIMYFNIASQLEEKNCSQRQYNEEIEYAHIDTHFLNWNKTR